MNQFFIDWELSVQAIAEFIDSDIQWCVSIWFFKTDFEMWRQLIWQLLTIQSRKIFLKEALSTNELSQFFIDWELSVQAIAESIDSDI